MNCPATMREAAADAFRNLRLRNCEYIGIGSEDVLQRLRFIACSRNDGPWQAGSRAPSAWTEAAPARSAVMQLAPLAPVYRGDTISIRFSGSYNDQPCPARVQIRAMGLVVLTVPLEARQHQELSLDLELIFGGGSFRERRSFRSPATHT